MTAPDPIAYPEGTGSLGPGRCSVCGKPWVWNITRRLWVAVCDCHKPIARAALAAFSADTGGDK